MRNITHLVIHHSASDPHTTTVKDILDWHRAKGWVDIGYHWVVDHQGIIHEGRPWHHVGAHCTGYNVNSFGVCGIGDNTKPDRRWSQAQAATLGQVADSIRLFYPKVQVVGHKELGKTACPGINIHQLIQQDWVLTDALFL